MQTTHERPRPVGAGLEIPATEFLDADAVKGHRPCYDRVIEGRSLHAPFLPFHGL